MDHRRLSRIGRGDDPCCPDVRVDSGGEGEAKMSKRITAKVFVDGRRVRFEELVHSVDHGICRFAVNQWDGGVFEALHKLIDGGGRHGGGEELINN